MSLERKSTTKKAPPAQQYIDLSAASKRENNFSKMSSMQSNSDGIKTSQSAVKMKPHYGTPGGHNNNNMMMTMNDATADLTSDRFRKATLSPP